jgi:hypothetical protein
MKPSIILEQKLYETKMYSRLTAGMDPRTAGYMQKVRENFTLPFIASLNNISTLMEAEMTAQQVQNAFGSAEKIATAGGDNRSMLGKGADAAGAVGAGAVDLAKKGASGVKELANKLLAQNKDKLVQSLPPADAGPVEGFEQKAQEQIAQVQDPKAKQSLMDLVKQAAKNPAVQTMVLAAVGGIATVVAGPAIAGLGLGMAVTGALTGTVVGGLTGAVRGAMQGEGVKGALKQGAMGAGLGAIGGGVAGAIAQGAQSYMQNKNQPQLPAADADANRAADENAAAQWAAGTPEERAQIEQTTGMTAQQLQSKIPDEFDSGPGKGWDGQTTAATPAASKVSAVQSTPGAENFDGTATSQQQQDASNAVYQQAKAADANGSTTTQQFAGPDAKDQAYGRVRANLDNWRADNAAAKTMTQSRVNTGKPLNEYVDYELTARMWYIRESVGKPRGNIHLTEAGIGDMFKKAGNWLKTKAGNVTNKVTADKLQQAWKKAGNPTDSGQVAGIMVGAGVPQETVDQIFQNLGLPTGASTVTAAPKAPEKAPGQGLLGRAAGAIGGAIGGVKGAIAGTKDAFAQGKQTGFDSARAGQAGDAVGATGEANPYVKQPAPAGEPAQTQTGGVQSPAGPGGVQAAQISGSTQGGPVGKTAPGPDTDTTTSQSQQGKPQTDIAGTINKGAGLIDLATNALNAGNGMGVSGRSLAQDYSTDKQPSKNDIKIKDAYGQEHAYKKVGQQWFDKDNKPVNSAQAAMLDKQAEQQAALTKEKPGNATAQTPAQKTVAIPAKAEPISVGGQKLDPKDPASAKIIAQVQQAQGGAQQAGATPPALGKQSDGKPIKPGQKFDTETGKPLAQQPGATPPAQTPTTAATPPATAQQPGATPPAGGPAHTTPNFGKQMTGYSKTTMNAPTGVPAVVKPAVPATTNATTQPAQPEPQGTTLDLDQFKKDQAAKRAQQTTPATPGFMQTKLNGGGAKRSEPALTAGIDFSAALLRKMKQRV